MLFGPDGRVLVVTNRGLIVADAPGAEARMLCIEALGLSTSEPAFAAWTPRGEIVVASNNGLQRSADGGCSLTPVEPLGNAQVTAMAAETHAGDRFYVAVFDPDVGGVYRSDDGAASFTRVLPLGDDDYVYSLAMAPSDPDTVYASGWQFGSADADSRYLRRSGDAGASWERFELPLTDAEEHAEIVAIHPTNPGAIVLRTIALDPSTTLERVLVAHDGGASFEDLFEAESVRGCSYARDGAELWIAARAGLWRAEGSGTPTRVSGPEEMSCVLADEGLLLACGHYEGVTQGHDGVGLLDSASNAFVPWLDFVDVAGTLTCATTASAAAQCAGPWRDWSSEVGTPDAGAPSAPAPGVADAAPQPQAVDTPVAPDAGTAAPLASAAPPPNEDAAAGGCSVDARGPSAHFAFAPWWLVLAWLVRRRRCKRPGL